MRNKNIVLGIIIPLFFIFISSNVLGNVYVGNSDGMFDARGYSNEPIYWQTYNTDIIHEIYVPTDNHFLFFRQDNTIYSVNKTGSTWDNLRNWEITGNHLAYETRFYTIDSVIRERDLETGDVIEIIILPPENNFVSFESLGDYVFLRDWSITNDTIYVYLNNTLYNSFQTNFSGDSTPTIRSFSVDEDYIYVTKRRSGSSVETELSVFDYDGNEIYNIELTWFDGLTRRLDPRTIKVKNDIIYIGGDDGWFKKYHTNGTLIQRKNLNPYEENVNDVDVDDAGFVYVASGSNYLIKYDTNLNLQWIFHTYDSARAVGVQGTSINHNFIELFEIKYELDFVVGGVLKWGANFIVNDSIVDSKSFGTQSWFSSIIPDDIPFNVNVTANITYTYDDITNITTQYNFTTPESLPIPLPRVTENKFKIVDNIPTFSVSLDRFSYSSFTFPDYLYNFETEEFECIDDFCGVLDNVFVVINNVEFPLEILYKPESEVERAGAYTIYDDNVYNSKHELINETEWGGETIFYLGNIGNVSLPSGNYEYYYKALVYDTTTEEFFELTTETKEFELKVPRAEWKSYFEPVKNVPSHLGSDNWSTGFRTLVVVIALIFIVFLLFVFTSNNGIEVLFFPLVIIAVTLLLIYFTISGVIPFWVFLLILFLGIFILFKRFSS